MIKSVYAHWEAKGVEIDFAMRSLFSGVRFSVAGLALLLLAKYPGREWRATPLRWMLALALTQTVGQYVLFYLGLSLSSGALASLLISSGSFWWVLLAPRFGHSPALTKRQWVILVVGGLGVTIAVYSPGISAGNPQLGALLLLGASLFGALGLLFFQRMKPTMGARAGTGYSLLIGGLILTAMGWPAVARGDWVVFDSFVIVWTAWLAFVSAAAFALWNHLSTLMPAHELATYRFLIPLFGVVESILWIENERLTLPMVIGGILALAAMTQLQRDKTSR
ncbi:MAG: DMT family transporter [Synoicihabitans sp.]